MKLLESLRTHDGGPQLEQRLLGEIRTRAQDKLQRITGLFPLYTDHSIRHSDSVVRLLDQIVPDAILKQLNKWEIYFLLASAYLHDIGMVEGCPGIPFGDDWNRYLSQRQNNPKGGSIDDRSVLRDYIRDTHHLRSEAYIRSNAIELGLRATDTQAEAHIVARISSGHRVLDLADQARFGEIAFQDSLIRRDLLAGYLRLADELDTTAHRTPVAEYQALNIDDEQSAHEWNKHLSISGITISGGTISISGECHDHGIFLRLVSLQRGIQTKLDELRKMLRRPYASGDGFHADEPLPYHTIELKVEHLGYLPLEINFELNSKEIIQVLMGESLYGDKSAAIREVLQNGVDACQEASHIRPSSWRGEISISMESSSILVVEDNGIGMNEEIVRKYFSQVGKSYYRSSDFSSSFDPISRFGIGFLSCFMIADHVRVETKMDDHDALVLEMDDPTQPIVPRRGTRRSSGTRIELQLSDRLADDFAPIAIARRYCRYAPIAIVIRSPENQSELISQFSLSADRDHLIETMVAEAVRPSASLYDEPLSQTQDELIASVIESLKSSGEHHHFYSARDNIEVAIVLKGGLRDFLHSKGLSATYAYRSMSPRLYQDGFLVEDGVELLGFRDLLDVTVLVSGSAKFALTADRTRIVESESNPTMNLIQEMISDLIEQAYTRKHPGNESHHWWNFHIQYSSNVVDLLTEKEAIPEALANSIDTSARYCVLRKDGFAILRPSEMNNKRKYWANSERHFGAEWMSALMDEDSMVIFARVPFPPAVLHRHWSLSYLGISLESDIRQLLDDSGVTIERNTIIDRDVGIITSHVPPDVWFMQSMYSSDTNQPTIYLNGNHALTTALTNLELEDRTSPLYFLLQEYLSNLPYSNNGAKYTAYTRLIVKELISLGIQVDELSLFQSQWEGPAPHDCPYFPPIHQETIGFTSSAP